MLNLDTHILVDALSGDLTRKETILLSRNRWCISAIVLWEISTLRQLGRVDLEIQSIEFSRALSQITIIPLSIQICQMSIELDFSSDPADALISATSVVHKVPLFTRDKKILRSSIVPFAEI